ncbi:MAG: MCE family protein [Mycobacterium sp.]|uniref:MCE family protein n=1 Tax=Mycobacterium sp. TaxID=1785 RepID=UPI001EB78ED3|nr:MlaD family protein [Mycobacterium sp.]MBV8788538.1 MCE family protein [Mycobacterium sp.]
MLTRFVRIQLTIFTLAAVIGMGAMVFEYMQVPTLLGIGRFTVKLELPDTGGLYRFSNVTYRGVQVGKVTAVGPTSTGAEATLSLQTSPKIPADLHAAVRSVSAVGEQYVDLVPQSEHPPYLRDGSVISAVDTSIPPPVGPMLDKLSALVNSVPKDKLSQLLDSTFTAFNGKGYDLGSLLDSSSRLSHDADDVVDHTQALVNDSSPFLDAQAETTDSIRQWAHSLAGATDQLVTDDPQFRKLLHTGPSFAQEISRLLNQVKPTLPVLLANLTTVGQIGVTYHPSLEQLLVLLPPYVAATSSYGVTNNPTGLAVGGFALTIADPPACTVGFLPPSQWRSPADTSEVDTPDNLYCKLPQDSPISVRGARNYPCMGKPGKRAPTVEICNSDKPYVPLAMRQHALGPYPFDPNLASQGVAPDDRVGIEQRTFGPVDGTPLPPGAVRSGTPPGPPAPGSLNQPPTAPQAGAAPSAFNSNGSGVSPSVAVLHYDPRTGRYVAPDGQMYRQSDLVRAKAPKTWKDMLLTSG